jgi:hypothetical protein
MLDIQDAKFNMKVGELEANINAQSHFICEFKTFSNLNSSYEINLYFENEFENTTLTSNRPIVQSVQSISYSPSMIPIISNGEISIPFNYQFPTNYSGYILAIKSNLFGSFVNIGNCSFSIPFLNCSVSSMNSILSSTTKAKFDIFINNERSLSLTPYFTFYNDFKLSEILPSVFVEMNHNDSLYLKSLVPLQYFGESIKVKYSFNGNISIHNCVFSNETQVQCQYPRFTEVGMVSIWITQTQSIYEELTTKLLVYNISTLKCTEIKPAILSFTNQTIVDIIGIGFFNSKDIIVIVYDTFVGRYSKGIFVSDSVIKTTIDPFFDINGIYPRELKMKISFDGGVNFINAGKLSVNNHRQLEISPKLISLREKTSGIKISNFPKDGLYYNKNDYTIDYKLIRNDSVSLTMNCVQNTTVLNCELNSLPLSVGFYKFKLEKRNFKNGETNDIYIFAQNEVYIYDMVVNSVDPKKIVLNSTEKVIVSGNWNSKLFTSVKFRFKFSVNSLFAFVEKILFVPGNVTETALVANSPSNKEPMINLEVSFTFNDVNFHAISFIQLPLYSIDNVRNLEGEGNNFLSSSSSPGRITGNNFINSGILLILQTSKETFDITSISNINFKSNSQIDFRFPNVTEIGFKYELRYPLSLTLGLSFNGGNYYAKSTISYLNSHLQSVFSGIVPTITPRKGLNFTVFGVKLEYTRNCSFYADSEGTIEVYDTPINYLNLESNFLTCFLPLSVQLSYNSLYISLKNKEGEKNVNSKEILFYTPPYLSSTIPTQGDSFGGFPIQIFGQNIPRPLGNNGIYCKFGQIVCEKECQWISSSEVKCTTQGHPPALIDIYLSYNKLDWHNLIANATRYQSNTCESGYTAKDYRESCHLCPPGTFKPAPGLFECTPCENNRYTLFSGAKNCETCPDNTTTGSNVRGSNSFDKCVCEKNFYLNPNYDEHSGAHKKCITCPVGASCDNLNTTVPVAKFGYWNYKTNYHNFYLCKPKNSCPGYSAENCTMGYRGIRCGQCMQQWYKFRGECRQCERTEITWLRLLGLSGAFALITGLFFALSSTKVQHIASIAIAFSFWQILSMLARFDIQWPSLIGGSLTASSVSNFNVDFLSPNCIFPSLDYIALWIIQMMLPIAFLVCFVILYILLIIRSLFTIPIKAAINICMKIKYLKPSVKNEEEEPEKNFKKVLSTGFRFVGNTLKFIVNFTIWFFTQKSTGRQFMKIFNRIINSYFAVLSFSFIFIMTTSSEIFACTKQPDGIYTLDASPDITCYQGQWLFMLPLTLFWYLLFGGGSLFYFVLIYFNFKKWSNSKNFVERNKFMLSRFKKKYFFWEAVVTLRKTILSILYIFLDDMLVIVAGIVLLFIGFLLHTNFVPFKRKFHNVMDYFVILVTITTLFFGFLFFVDNFPPGTKAPAEYLSFGIIIISTVIVISMILWDANTRRKNDKKKEKKKLQNIADIQQRDKDTRDLLNALHERDAHDDLFKTNQVVPWNVDYEFEPFGFKTDTETPEEDFKTMNDIFSNLFSWARLSRKYYLIKRKGAKSTAKIIKKFQKKSKEEKELEFFVHSLKQKESTYREELRNQSNGNLISKELENKMVKQEMKKKTNEFILNQENEKKVENEENSNESKPERSKISNLLKSVLTKNVPVIERNFNGKVEVVKKEKKSKATKESENIITPEDEKINEKDVK